MATISGDDESYPADTAGTDLERRSTLSVLRDVVVDLTHIVEDSTDLVSASVREELERVRVEMTRQAFVVTATVAGAAFLSAGLAMFIARWLDSWPATLLIFGALYIGCAIGLVFSRERPPPT